MIDSEALIQTGYCLWDHRRSQGSREPCPHISSIPCCALWDDLPNKMLLFA